MVTRRPLVVQDGFVAELPVGDTVAAGTSTTEVIAGSGLVGGGSVSSNPRVDFALAANPSGIIYVGDSLGIDGAAQISADTALASGSAAAVLADSALASGNASLVTASAALASGNAALDLVPTLGGGGGGTVAEFTAASAVASGYVVGFDDAGKVQSIREDITDNTDPMSFPSSFATYSTGSPYQNSAAYDSFNNKIFIAYRDDANSLYGTGVVGTVSGTTISFGTPVVFNSQTSQYLSCTFDSTSNKVVIAFQDSVASGYPYAVVATISGTSVSYGTKVNLISAAADGLSSTYDSLNNRVVISFRNQGGSNYGTTIVGTVSGTSISFGTSVVFKSSNSGLTSSTFDSTSGKVLVFYRNFITTAGESVVGTVSGTSISFGSPVTFNSSASIYIGSAYDTANQRVLVCYRDGGSSEYGVANVGTVSGTSISFGSKVTYASTTSDYNQAAFDSTNNRVVISFVDNSNGNKGLSVVGSISGTSVSFGASTIYETNTTNYPSIVYNSVEDHIVIAYHDSYLTTYGRGIVAESLFSLSVNPTLNSYPNVLGIAQSTVASGSTCLVNLPGTLYNDPAAGLTTGAFYYANPTTSGVTTTSTKPTSWDGQVPWNYIGRAVTSSGLMLLKSI
jgi:hypothetical protein